MQNAKLTARGFTASAIHILEQLGSRAADRRMSGEIVEETMNLLVLRSMLLWERKVGMVALEKMGVDLNALSKDVDLALTELCSEIRRHKGPQQYQTLPSGQRAVVVDFDTPLEPLLAAAEAEALWMDHTYIGTEHLLLGTIRRADPRLKEVFTKHGITYVKTKGTIIEVLRSTSVELSRPDSHSG
jgi:ATP-dependent Clp protease ATP-binding subunit ClpA